MPDRVEPVDAPVTSGVSPRASSGPVPSGFSVPTKGGLWKRAAYVIRGLAPFARPHGGAFLKGALAALFVVTCRLVLPWPLRAVADQWVDRNDSGLMGLVPAGFDPVVTMGVVFLAVIVTLGLADLLERLYFARFAIAMVRDLRAEAFRSAVQINPELRKKESGDLVARLVGDTARIKTGVQGFLVHVATNSVVFVGVTCVLFYLEFRLGLIFAIAGLATCLVMIWGASRLFDLSSKHREKEGKLANIIQRAMRKPPDDARFARINKSSGTHEASSTRIQGIATWCGHGLYGVAVLAALLVGAQAVNSGRMLAGDMVVFMMYALMIRGPIIRLARQGSRTGRILGTADRVVQVIHAAPPPMEGVKERHLKPLRKSLVLEGLTWGASGSEPLQLQIRAGERIAAVAESGESHRALLEVIAGVRPARTGRILWDGKDLNEVSRRARAVQIVYEPRTPVVVEMDDDEADDEAGIGERLSRMLSLIHKKASLWLFDGPSVDLPKKTGEELVRALLSTDDSTVVVAIDRHSEAAYFDRVLAFRAGRLVFDGPPAQWRASDPERDR